MDYLRVNFFETISDIRKAMSLEIDKESDIKFHEMRIEYKKQIKQLETTL